MAPARSSGSPHINFHQRLLAESQSVIEEMRRRDALVKPRRVRQMKASANFTKRQPGGLEAPSAVVTVGQILNNKDTPAVHVHKAFARLPAEINQEIVKYLSDKDLAAFALVQRETRDAILPIHAGHWRVRYREQFDMHHKMSPAAIVADYKLRKRLFLRKKPVFFGRGYGDEERSCLVTIRKIINESRTHCRETPSNNYRQLARFMMRSNLLFNAFRGMEPSDAAGGDIQHLVNPLLMTIHVFFFPYYLSFTVDDTLRGAVPLAFRQTAYNIKWSQDILLAPPELPLVTHQGAIDIGLLYHMTNFWRFHIVLNEDSSIFNIFSRLPDDYKPRAPTRKLKNNKLSFKKNWVGAIFHPNGQRSRDSTWNNWDRQNLQDVYTDGFFTGCDGLINLDVDWAPGEIPWPAVFEEQVHAIPDPVDDLAHVLSHKNNILPVEKSLSTEGRRRIRPKNHTSTPRSGPEAYRASLPLRPMASNDGYAEVVRKTKQLKYGIFFGTFDDNHGASPLNIAGVVHPLPPQHAIPGWQRVTMVAYETPESGTASKGYLDAGYWDLSIYMRFEGVSCPGANVMLGRYHIGKKYDDDDDDRQFKKRGPFIFWDAGGNQAGDDSTTDEEDSEDTDGTNPATEDDNEDNEDETYWLQMLQAHHAQNAT